MQLTREMLEKAMPLGEPMLLREIANRIGHPGINVRALTRQIVRFVVSGEVTRVKPSAKQSMIYTRNMVETPTPDPKPAPRVTPKREFDVRKVRVHTGAITDVSQKNYSEVSLLREPWIAAHD